MPCERASVDHRRRPLWAAMGVLAAVLVGPPAAVHADDVESAAQVHLDRGIAAYGAADYPTAQTEFATASALVPHKANPFRWLALTEIQLGDCEHAAADVDSFVARVPAGDARVPELLRARDACRPRDPAAAAAAHVVDASPVKPLPPPAHHSIVTRPWFWVVVVGVAATTVGVILFASGDDPTATSTIGPPIDCGTTGCARGFR